MLFTAPCSPVLICGADQTSSPPRTKLGRRAVRAEALDARRSDVNDSIQKPAWLEPADVEYIDNPT